MPAIVQNQVASDEDAIRELIAQWSKAVRDEDLAGIGAHHDPQILMFDVPPPFQIQGLEAYMVTWKTFLDWSIRPVAFDIHDVQVFAGTDVAFATAIGQCSGTGKTGETIQLAFRLTLGFRKRNGQWWVIHEHHSLPAND